jgi:hypothetical protein
MLDIGRSCHAGRPSLSRMRFVSLYVVGAKLVRTCRSRYAPEFQMHQSQVKARIDERAFPLMDRRLGARAPTRPWPHVSLAPD